MPSVLNRPFSRFSTTDIAQVAIEEGIVESISPITVWRWLDSDAIRPWYQQTWVFPRDPQFLTKAQPVLDLYHRIWQGNALTDGDYIISADEKRMVALSVAQRQSTAAGQIGRYDYEYERHGTLVYLAALDVCSGQVIGRTDQTNGIAPFTALVNEVMSQAPYATANRVFWIVDNGSAHHPSTFGDRLATAYPNAIAVHLPTHASWLNQIEIYFSILHRKLLKPNDFDGLIELMWKLESFEAIYNETATPFHWKFTYADLKHRFEQMDRTLYGLMK